MLTDHQREACRLHLHEDWSFTELAEHFACTRSGAHDLVRRALAQLEHFEERLGHAAELDRRDRIEAEPARPPRDDAGERLTMFEALSDRLAAALRRFSGRGRLTKEDVEVGLREVRVALLEADVNFRVARAFVDRIRERAIGSDVLESLTPGQQIVKIVNDELVALLGGEQRKIQLPAAPADGDHAGRPPGLRQDDHRRQARTRDPARRAPSDAGGRRHHAARPRCSSSRSSGSTTRFR